jgi:hypothetical protein
MSGHGSGFRAPVMDVVDWVDEPPATPSNDAAKISAVFYRKQNFTIRTYDDPSFRRCVDLDIVENVFVCH